ncbi:hypothetical protein KEM56_000110 [Ascosphaera pollenicola]|nr:hypothetical protein KEM56_000110 [Ascosphaera pollenicola]
MHHSMTETQDMLVGVPVYPYQGPESIEDAMQKERDKQRKMGTEATQLAIKMPSPDVMKDFLLSDHRSSIARIRFFDYTNTIIIIKMPSHKLEAAGARLSKAIEREIAATGLDEYMHDTASTTIHAPSAFEGKEADHSWAFSSDKAVPRELLGCPQIVMETGKSTDATWWLVNTEERVRVMLTLDVGPNEASLILWRLDDQQQLEEERKLAVARDTNGSWQDVSRIERIGIDVERVLLRGPIDGKKELLEFTAADLLEAVRVADLDLGTMDLDHKPPRPLRARSP